ncbi:apoptosis-inducing factor 3 isoform X3 [Lucilia sericata]|uniref:apoptosis-inducing factor 3 isoform X3 n=2 Tax=Lucilia sericata TaxID=13632 RepID=UPI0018A815B8|nr:apoptosis-inducing factor 3 isoform X3 [Lucilia sericata]
MCVCTKLFMLIHIHRTPTVVTNIFSQKLSKLKVSPLNITSKKLLHSIRNHCGKPPQTVTSITINGNLNRSIRFNKHQNIIINRFYTVNWPTLFLRSFPRSLRHCFQLQLSQQQQVVLQHQQLNTKRLLSMGSINCKEYVTANDACANQPENGTTGSGSYQSTCEKKMSDEYTDSVAVCNVNDLQEHDMKQFNFDENTKVLVVKQNNQIKAVGSKCTHYGAPLHTGVLGDGRVRCPWHGACFNIDTGDIEDFPGLDSLPCFKVDVEKDGQVMLRAKRKDLESSKRLKDMVKRDPKNHLCYVIIGGGPSGAVCAETLRQEGFTGRIVMVCKEEYLPYDRVKITKASDIKIDTIQFRKHEFYDEYGIETLMSTEATKVDCETKTVFLSNDTTLKYDKMFIATGCSASKPPIKGVDLNGVVVVREYEDLRQINKLIKPEANVVCLGSSFIALESAQNWVKKVKSMTVISRTEFPLMASFGSAIGERVLRLYRDQGVNMVMSSGIVEAIGDSNNKLTEVVLTDGTKLPCDILIMGTGSRFNTKFLVGSGLPINANGSIDSDIYLKSLVDDVYVGGDIVNAPVYSYNNQRATIGHYQLAQYHGRIAAINMVGNTPQELQAVPFFFTMLFGKGFRYSGYGSYSDVVIEGDLENLKFVAYFIDEQDNVVAVASCGRDPIVAQFAELQSQGKKLIRSDLQNPNDPTAWTKLLKEPVKCF